LAIDVVGALIERATSDSSPRVRRVAVHQLGLQPHDPRAIETLVRLIAESRDAGLVSRARHALGEQRARGG
jgi:HEAT repeat protein